MSGYFRRARVHSVRSLKSGGSSKFSYSMPGYSRKGFCARNTPQIPNTPREAMAAAVGRRMELLPIQRSIEHAIENRSGGGAGAAAAGAGIDQGRDSQARDPAID